MTIYNLLGQEVVSKAVIGNDIQIDLSDLSTGTYIAKINAASKSKTIKIVKEEKDPSSSYIQKPPKQVVFVFDKVYLC